MIPTTDTKTLIRKARILSRQGAFQQAASIYMQAAVSNGGKVDILLEIAKDLENINCYREAERVFLQALESEPENYIIHSRLAAFYVAMEEMPGAFLHFEKALKIDPDNPEILFNLALAHQVSSDFEKALDIFKRALEAGADPRLVSGSIATIYEQTNRLDELKSLLVTAIKEFPDDAYLNFIAAKTNRREENFKSALKFLERTRTSPEFGDIEMRYYFEKGRIFDKLVETDKAYENFLKGNRVCLEQNQHIGASKEESLAITSGYNKLDYSNWKQLSAPAIEEEKKNPVFLVGFPRSGTTLLHQILDGHFDIEILEEQPHISSIGYMVLSKTGTFPEGIPQISADLWSKSQRDYLSATRKMCKKGPNTKLIDKLPLNIINIPLILKVFPGAKFIVMLRHPCDCTLSCFMQNFGFNNAMLNFTNLDDSTGYYAEVFRLWNKYRHELDLDYHYIRYEDVIADLEGEARKVISFLGLPWDQNVLEYRKKALEKKHINTPSYHQVVKPIYQDAKGRWRHYEKYLSPYIERLAPYIKEFGYGEGV